MANDDEEYAAYSIKPEQVDMLLHGVKLLTDSPHEGSALLLAAYIELHRRYCDKPFVLTEVAADAQKALLSATFGEYKLH